MFDIQLQRKLSHFTELFLHFVFVTLAKVFSWLSWHQFIDTHIYECISAHNRCVYKLSCINPGRWRKANIAEREREIRLRLFARREWSGRLARLCKEDCQMFSTPYLVPVLKIGLGEPWGKGEGNRTKIHVWNLYDPLCLFCLISFWRSCWQKGALMQVTAHEQRSVSMYTLIRVLELSVQRNQRFLWSWYNMVYKLRWPGVKRFPRASAEAG